MVDREWRNFTDELMRWRDSGRTAEFWWRDDDASRPDPALDRLYALASGTGVPLGLAAVPMLAEPGAFAGLPANVCVLQHGADHQNRARAGDKKTEFPADEPVSRGLERLKAGRTRLASVASGKGLPVLVPPWNRLSIGLTACLAEAGYLGLSTFGVRNVTNPVAGLKQVNTHIDIIDWKGTRGFCGTEHVLGQATRALAAQRVDDMGGHGPIGWLTHHAVHDAAAWDFLERLFDVTRATSDLCWRSPASLFGGEPL